MYLSTFCISSREYISFSKFILPVDDISEKSLLTKDNAATIDSLGMYTLPDIVHPFHIEISLYLLLSDKKQISVFYAVTY